MYEFGRGVPQDYGEAAACYKEAADQGDAIAQRLMSAMYEFGRGVPQDYRRAAACLGEAAKLGDPVARYLNQLLLDHHLDKPEDCRGTVEWFVNAAKQGDAVAELWLKKMQGTGWDKPRGRQMRMNTVNILGVLAICLWLYNYILSIVCSVILCIILGRELEWQERLLKEVNGSGPLAERPLVREMVELQERLDREEARKSTGCTENARK